MTHVQYILKSLKIMNITIFLVIKKSKNVFSRPKIFLPFKKINTYLLYYYDYIFVIFMNYYSCLFMTFENLLKKKKINFF